LKSKKLPDEETKCCGNCSFGVVMFNLLLCRLTEERKLASDYCGRWDSWDEDAWRDKGDWSEP
jgi:hypothetical protein